MLHSEPFINFFAVSCHLIKYLLILFQIFFYFEVVHLVILNREYSYFLVLLLGSNTIPVVFSSDGVKEGPSYRRIFVLHRKKGWDLLLDARQSCNGF